MGVLSRNSDKPLVYAADGSVYGYQIGRHEEVVLSAAGVRVALDAADRRVGEFPLTFTNTSAGLNSVSCTGWACGDGGVVLAPGESVRARPVRVSGNWYWGVTGRHVYGEALRSYTPTVTWTGGPPTATNSAVYRYCNGGVWFAVTVTVTDGGGATGLTVTPPLIPPDLNVHLPLSCSFVLDGTASNPLCYLDMESAAGADRLVKFFGLPTLTDDKAVSLRISGWYPLDPMFSFTPVSTWGTKTPTTGTLVGSYARWSNVATWFAADVAYADSDAADGFGLALPLSSLTPDIDAYVALPGHCRRNTAAAYRDIIPWLDCANATAESRKISANGWTAPTDNEVVRCAVTGVYPTGGWSAFDCEPDWTGTDPGTVTEKAFFDVSDGLCHFLTYLSSADGNGATGLTLRPPVAPAQSATSFALNAVQVVDTTYSRPGAYVDASDDDPTERKVVLTGFSTATDAVAVKVAVAGSYPVV